MRRIRAVARLSAAERTAALRAFVLLPLVAVAVRARGLQRVQSRLAVSHHSQRSSKIESRRLGHIVNRVGSVWRANCLTRSLVTWWLLDRRGTPSELRIGVRKAAEGLEFHAWIETEGTVVNDRVDIAEEFSPFAEPIGLRQRFV